MKTLLTSISLIFLLASCASTQTNEDFEATERQFEKLNEMLD